MRTRYHWYVITFSALLFFVGILSMSRGGTLSDMTEIIVFSLLFALASPVMGLLPASFSGSWTVTASWILWLSAVLITFIARYLPERILRVLFLLFVLFTFLGMKGCTTIVTGIGN